jgi:hypothetical protein
MPPVRTTITLDPDVAQLVQRRMRERQQSFKEVVNEAIRESAAVGTVAPFRTTTASLGESAVNLDRALQVAADIEDDELIRKMRAAK